MCRALDDAEFGDAAERLHRGPVETEYVDVGAADEEQDRTGNAGEGIARKVGTPAARNDGAYPRLVRCRDEGRRRAGARPEQSDRKPLEIVVRRDPAKRGAQPFGKQWNIEDRAAIIGLVRFEEVEQQRAQALGAERVRDGDVARAVATAPAAVGEYDESSCITGNPEVAGKDDPLTGGYADRARALDGAAGFAAGASGPGLLEEADHLVVRYLTEIRVPEADGAQLLRRVQHHHPIGFPGKALHDRRRCDRRGDDDRGRATLTGRLEGGADRAARSDAVVDDDRGAPRELGEAPEMEALLGAIQFGNRALRRPFDICGAEIELLDQRVIEDDAPAFRDRADAEFRLEWCADLADRQDIERCGQAARDLEADRNAASGERDDDRAVQRKRREAFGESAARVRPVRKESDVAGVEGHAAHATSGRTEGAGSGNRTRITGLEGQCSTFELYPLVATGDEGGRYPTPPGRGRAYDGTRLRSRASDRRATRVLPCRAAPSTVPRTRPREGTPPMSISTRRLRHLAAGTVAAAALMAVPTAGAYEGDWTISGSFERTTTPSFSGGFNPNDVDSLSARFDNRAKTITVDLSWFEVPGRGGVDMAFGTGRADGTCQVGTIDIGVDARDVMRTRQVTETRRVWVDEFEYRYTWSRYAEPEGDGWEYVGRFWTRSSWQYRWERDGHWENHTETREITEVDPEAYERVGSLELDGVNGSLSDAERLATGATAMQLSFGSPLLSNVVADCVEIRVPGRRAPFVIAPPATEVPAPEEPAPSEPAPAILKASSTKAVNVGDEEIGVRVGRQGSRLVIRVEGTARKVQVRTGRKTKTMRFRNTISLKGKRARSKVVRIRFSDGNGWSPWATLRVR